jgi:hypothetical protein
MFEKSKKCLEKRNFGETGENGENPKLGKIIEEWRLKNQIRIVKKLKSRR